MYSLYELSLFAATVFIAYCIHNYFKNRRFWMLLEDFYEQKPWPLVGNAFQLGTNSEEITAKLLKLCERGGFKTYKITIGSQVFVNLCEPDTVEAILTNTKEISKMKEYYHLKDWLGDGLLLSTGNTWKSHRKLLTPAFHFKILEKFIKGFNDNGNILVDKLSNHTGELFDIYPFINACTLDVICDTIMGVNVNAQNNSNSEYMKAVKSMCLLLGLRFTSPLKKYMWIYKMSTDYAIYKKNKEILHDMPNSVIRERKLKLKDEIERVKRGDTLFEEDEFIKAKRPFLDVLLLSRLPNGNFLTDEEVREETDTFMFEGHDTTSAAVAFAIYELSKNPDVQRKTLKEIISILGEDKHVTYEDLYKLKYLEMVIKETLRLYPPVPKFGRRIEDDVNLPEGKTIPGDCTVIIDHIGMGRNPQFYPNPERFDPERFSLENSIGRHPFLFVPFSAGLRNCIGQKYAMLLVKTILCKTLQRYELISGGEENNVRLCSDVTLKSANGVQIYIKKRNSVD